MKSFQIDFFSFKFKSHWNKVVNFLFLAKIENVLIRKISNSFEITEKYEFYQNKIEVFSEKRV